MQIDMLLGLIIAMAGLLVLVMVVLAVVLAQLMTLKKTAVTGMGTVVGSSLEEREMTLRQLRENREELANSLSRFEESLRGSSTENHNALTSQLVQYLDALNAQLGQSRDALNAQLEQSRNALNVQLAENRETVEKRLTLLQQQNDAKLEQMRQTVDEKLQETVERRFAESFKLISDRLEAVHKGLGEMQTLASGVDDLKKVLANVKTRGNLGEYQLSAILEQVLSPEQYIHNAQVKQRSQERVEFAIRLPGKTDEQAELLLPIDSKFPVEDYERLLEALEGGGTTSDGTGVDEAARRFEDRVRRFARDIRDKYINPPTTTDFAIMFVPTEGLYAEIVRRTALFEMLQRECRVTVVGPTNLVAFLNSLQMGFRTLAIEKRSSEVWVLLAAVKTEFGKFEGVLDKVKGKLDAASRELDKVGTRSRVITRKLRKVQELPAQDSSLLLGDGDTGEDAGGDVSELEDASLLLGDDGGGEGEGELDLGGDAVEGQDD